MADTKGKQQDSWPTRWPMFQCVDWFHLWNMHGYCERCGKRLPESKEPTW